MDALLQPKVFTSSRKKERKTKSSQASLLQDKNIPVIRCVLHTVRRTYKNKTLAVFLCFSFTVPVWALAMVYPTRQARLHRRTRTAPVEN